MVPLANFQPKLDCPVNDHVVNVHGLMLGVGGSDDVVKPKKFFNGRKCDRNRALRMVCCLFNYVLALKEFMWHQLTVVFFEVN